MSLRSKVEDVLAALLDIPSGIIQGLNDVLIDGLKSLFIPDQENLNYQVSVLLDRFAWYRNIQNTAENLMNFISKASGKEPPVIHYHVGKSSGKWQWADAEGVIDFSWYEPYKPTVDLIVGGFLYVGFIWLLFTHLPGIIQGGDAATWYALDLPGRDSNSQKRPPRT